MTITDREFNIVIEDNGKGFRVGSAREGSDGLLNIRQRMTDIGGCLELSSELGQGTHVKLILQLTQLTHLYVH